MYNGIGLTTPRGSATSGHVTTNLSHIKPEFFRNKLDANSGKLQNRDVGNIKQARANSDVLEHNRKRSIEAKVFAFQEALLEKGFTDDEIEEKCAQLRLQLENSSKVGDLSKDSSKTDSHAIAMKKMEENAKIKAAFGIGDDFVEGAAFDPEIQEQRRQARLVEKEEANAKREKEKKEWETRKKRALEQKERIETERAKRMIEDRREHERRSEDDRKYTGERDRQQERRGDDDRKYAGERDRQQERRGDDDRKYAGERDRQQERRGDDDRKYTGERDRQQERRSDDDRKYTGERDPEDNRKPYRRFQDINQRQRQYSDETPCQRERNISVTDKEKTRDRGVGETDDSRWDMHSFGEDAKYNIKVGNNSRNNTGIKEDGRTAAEDTRRKGAAIDEFPTRERNDFHVSIAENSVDRYVKPNSSTPSSPTKHAPARIRNDVERRVATVQVGNSDCKNPVSSKRKRSSSSSSSSSSSTSSSSSSTSGSSDSDSDSSSSS